MKEGLEKGVWEGAEWKLADGEKTRFWMDCWGGNESFVDRFPRLCLNSEQQTHLVKDMGR